MTGADWTDGGSRVLVAVLYAAAAGDLPADRVALAFNAGSAAQRVRWPEPRPGMAWRIAIDTALPAGAPAAPMPAGATTPLAGRAVLVLVEEPGAAARGSVVDGVEPAVLARLAAAAGIAPTWQDVTGKRHEVSPDTTRALLAAMGLDARTTGQARERLVALAEARERRALPPVRIVPADAPGSILLADGGPSRRHPAALRLVLEDGREKLLPFDAEAAPASVATAADGRDVVQRRLALPPLPAGYHTLSFADAPGLACRIVSAPPRCHLPPELAAGGRRFGVTAHLYALTRAGDQGIGDFTSLAELAVATARAGGATVGINPLHALFAADRERASPYHPSDRRFLDPLYIDVARVPHLAGSSRARALLAGRAEAIARLSARDAVDYPGVWALKRAVLDACFAEFEASAGAAGAALAAEFDRFVAAGGRALRDFARFEAIAAAHAGLAWPDWPAGLRSPDGADVAAFAAAHARDLRFALYLQWLAARQLHAAATDARAAGLALGFYRDLAVGAAPDGAEAWANPDGGLARGVSIGAPPDPLAPGGQVWCLPPPIPGALSASGYAGFRELLAANMRDAGALRIDHVMSLARLFWIPDGATSADGAYVGYPRDDLFAVLALESQRARCLVVGEDLGTVPDDFRERMAAADILSYRVLWFERDGRAFRPPAQYAPKAAACVSTHDLPTIAGWWAGADIAENRALGFIDDAAADLAQAERGADRQELVAALAAAGAIEQAAEPGKDEAPIAADAPHTPAVTAAIHRYAGASPSALVLLQADDLAGETVALNLPGTDRERPNWRRRIRVAVDALWTTPAGLAATRDLSSRRR
jgi:glycogen operon protein